MRGENFLVFSYLHFLFFLPENTWFRKQIVNIVGVVWQDGVSGGDAAIITLQWF